MAPIELNLVIPQGETFELSFEFRHGLDLVRDLIPNATTPPTAITIAPLPIDLPSGFNLQFPGSGCETIDLVTAAITTAGSSTVAIAPYTGTKKIACGKQAQTLPEDLTGQVWTGQCRRKYGDTTEVFDWTFTINPLLGQVTGSVDHALTSAIIFTDKNRVSYSDIPKNYYSAPFLEVDDWTLLDPKFFAKSFVWDWERQLPSGKPERVFNGRAWITSEVTR